MTTRRKLLSFIPPLAATTMTGSAVGFSAAAAANEEAFFATPPPGLTLFPNVPLEQTRAAAERLRYANRPLTFNVYANETDVVSLKLDAIADEGSTSNTEYFSMMFYADTAEPLKEGLYAVHHADLGDFILNFTPSSHGDNGRYLRSSFLRLSDNTSNVTGSSQRLRAY